MKQKNKQPKLRFPQFDGDWEEKRLGEIFKIKYGKPYTHLDFGEIPLLGTGGVIGYVNESLYKKPSVLIGRKGTINKPRYINTPFWTVDTLFYTEIKSNYAPFFTYLLVCKINWLKYNEATGVPSLNTSSIKGVKVSLPSLAEQEKIADFFSALDVYLGQKKQRLGLLQEYKRGMMQQLFSGQKRFQPDAGGEFPAWERSTLDKHLVESRIKGNTGLDAKKITVKLWGKGVEHKENATGSVNTQYYKRKAGQFIYSKLDFLNCAFGIIPSELDGFESTLDLPTFDIKESIDPYFLLSLVSQKSFYKKNGEQANGSRKAKRIHPKDFLKFPIRLPSIAEQKKIAEFLEAIDDRIKLVEQSVAQLENWKKGLLQELLV